MSKVNLNVGVVAGSLLLIIIIFSIVGSFWYQLSQSADNLSGSGIPMSGLFQSSGLVGILIAIAVLLYGVKIIMTKEK